MEEKSNAKDVSKNDEISELNNVKRFYEEERERMNRKFKEEIQRVKEVHEKELQVLQERLIESEYIQVKVYEEYKEMVDRKRQMEKVTIAMKEEIEKLRKKPENETIEALENENTALKQEIGMIKETYEEKNKALEMEIKKIKMEAKTRIPETILQTGKNLYEIYQRVYQKYMKDLEEMVKLKMIEEEKKRKQLEEVMKENEKAYVVTIAENERIQVQNSYLEKANMSLVEKIYAIEDRKIQHETPIIKEKTVQRENNHTDHRREQLGIIPEIQQIESLIQQASKNFHKVMMETINKETTTSSSTSIYQEDLLAKKCISLVLYSEEIKCQRVITEPALKKTHPSNTLEQNNHHDPYHSDYWDKKYG